MPCKKKNQDKGIKHKNGRKQQQKRDNESPILDAALLSSAERVSGVDNKVLEIEIPEGEYPTTKQLGMIWKYIEGLPTCLLGNGEDPPWKSILRMLEKNDD